MNASCQPRRAFTLLELLVVMAIIGVLAGLLFGAVQRVRESAARTHCTNNLRQAGLALHGYHGQHQVFPSGVSYRGGKDPQPFMGWQARLLPFIEQEALWRTTLEAFKHESHFFRNPPHVGHSTAIAIYGCPADERLSGPFELGRSLVALTSYQGVAGLDQHRRDGMLYLDSAVRFSDVTDGTSQTLFVGERPPSADGALGWWYGGWGMDRNGAADTTLGVREQYNYANGYPCPKGPYEYQPGKSDNLCDTFHFWSLHSGGANFLFVDGSVRFLRYSANSILPALASRAGSEVVSFSD